MKFNTLVLTALILLTAVSARADDAETLRKKVDQLETELRELRARIDNLGPASARREVRAADPVFIGAGSTHPSPLAMDDPAINCPPHSFVTAIQILKTGNTVSQIRYACRGVE